MNTPKGYVALRNSYDGKTILVDARGLYVAPRPSEGGSKETCCVASVYYDDTGWTIAESFDEVCAKLAAALGEQTPPAAPALSETERAVIDAAIAYDDWIGGTPSLSKVGTAFTNAVRALRAARGGATPGAAP